MENNPYHDLAMDEWFQNDDTTMFYDDLPSLLDFPLMSPSPSSSSSSPSALTSAPPFSSSSDFSSSSSLGFSSSTSSWTIMDEGGDKINNNSKNNNNNNNRQYYTLEAQSTSSMEISQPMLDPSPNDPLDVGFGVGVGNCMDMMYEPLGFVELLESNTFFDPEFILQNHNEKYPLLLEEKAAKHHQQQVATQSQQQRQPPPATQEAGESTANNITNKEGKVQLGRDNEDYSHGDDEMRSIFFEWLKSNKDIVSINVLRSVKLRKATIDCAVKRLGGGKEGMKKLLKLILQWIQMSHLKNKKLKNTTPSTLNSVPNQNPNSILNLSSPFGTKPNPSFNQSPWNDRSEMVGYMGDSYANGASNFVNGTHIEHGNMLESTDSGPNSNANKPFGENPFPLKPLPACSSHWNKNHYQFIDHDHGDHRWRKPGTLASKEARKKRMDKQRKCFSSNDKHHHNHQDCKTQNQTVDRRTGSDNCSIVVEAPHANPSNNWVYSQDMACSAATVITATSIKPPPVANSIINQIAIQSQNCYQACGSSNKQSQVVWKPEKNLKFLLQKVLKQSDVGTMGRIVLPKKEAETHLPNLEARDGISIEMEDIGTSRVWNMRYRYWPNNKSRMYVLENTGDFVRANGLREGDFIVIFSDEKCGKFMIRGVKVKPAGAKSEIKKVEKHKVGNGANNGTMSSTQKKMKN